MSDVAHDAVAAVTGGRVMDVLSRSLRAMFVAAPGCRLVGGDFSNIEGRISAWITGEEWKLQAFREYDAGRGADLYRLAFSRAFGVPVQDVDGGDDKGPQRQVGKAMELACQFGGSCGAYLRFVRDISPIVATVKDVAFGNEAWREAEVQHDRLVYHNGLAREDWVGIKVVVNGWRRAHPATVQAWWDRADGVLEAVESPGMTVSVMGGKVRYLVADGFLWARLPSGKLLAYSSPRIVERKESWLVDEEGNAVSADEMAEDEIALRVAAGAQLQEGAKRLQVCYQGVNQKTRQWGRQYLYGGSLSNNDVQGTARELLRFAMRNVEDAGYPVVLHVHDELVSEVAQEFGSAEHFESLMSILPPWLEGLPLAAKAWESTRYVK